MRNFAVFFVASWTAEQTVELLTVSDNMTLWHYNVYVLLCFYACIIVLAIVMWRCVFVVLDLLKLMMTQISVPYMHLQTKKNHFVH